MGIAESTVEAVRTQVDILTIIQDYVSLKKRGRHYIGLCPFHSEKSGSFTVSVEKKLFYCFGCHASGDHISFVQQIDKLSFPEAIRAIAQRVGIAITETQSKESGQYQTQESVFRALSLANQLFAHTLAQIPDAQAYFLNRGLSAESITQFSLGYVPQTSIKSLLEKGVLKQDLLDAGLAVVQDGQLRARFIGRLSFPLRNHLGKVLGFGCRVFKQPSKAKYINSAESALFQKSQLIYGLDLAKKHIKTQGFAIVVEGYMDVIALHQIGYGNAVAVMGTAFVTQQAQLLQRFTKNLVLAFDQDLAGQAALLKSYEILQPMGFNVKVLQLGQKDPADVCLSEGKSAIDAAINKAMSFISFLILKKSQATYGSIEAKASVIKDLKALIMKEQDPLVQDHYLNEISTRFDISKNLIGFQKGEMVYNTKHTAPFTKKKDKYQKAEELILVAAVSSVAFRNKLKQFDESFIFQNTIYKQIYNHIKHSELKSDDVIQSFQDDSLKSQIIQLIFSDQASRNSNIQEQEFNDCLLVLKQRNRSLRISELRTFLNQHDASEQDVCEWLNELNELLKEERG